MAEQRLRNRLLQDIIKDLQNLSGSEFEQLARHILGTKHGGIPHVIGVGLDGKPVKGKVDLIFPDGTRVAFGTDADYFDDRLSKPTSDIVKFKHDGGNALVLASNRECPPTKKTTVDSTLRSLAAPATLEWWDGRKIGELILDIQPSDRLASELTQWLPSLKIALSFAALSHQVPLARDFVGRDSELKQFENIVSSGVRRLDVFGMSGIGKTALLAKLARSLASKFDAVIWLDGAKIKNASDLYNFSHDRSYDRINLVKACEVYAVLLVIDDASDERALPGVDLLGRSSVLLTSSQRKLVDSATLLPGLSPNDVELLLWQGVDHRPSESAEIARQVCARTKGHALAVALLNKAILNGDIASNDVLSELSHLPQAEDETGTLLTTRILGRHEASIHRELSFLSWLNVSVVDLDLLNAVVGGIGLGKLIKRGLAEADSHLRTLRMHDVVHACLRSVSSGDPAELKEFSESFFRHLRMQEVADSSEFTRLRNLHSKTIFDGADADSNNWPAVYAALHIDEPTREPIATRVAEGFLGKKIAMEDPDKQLKAWAVIEALEIEHRHRKRSSSDTLSALGELRALVVSDQTMDALVRHHSAKIMKLAGDIEGAVAEFRALADSNLETANASRLQLARLLKSDAREALSYLAQIFQRAEAGPPVPPSLVWAAIETLSFSHLSSVWHELAAQHEALIVRYVRSGLAMGEKQAIRMLGMIAGKFSRELPVAFDAITADFDFGSLPPTITKDDEERFRIGEIARYMALRKDVGIERDAFFQAALRFFDSIRAPTPYHVYSHAGCLTEAGFGAKALVKLEATPAANRDAFWNLAQSKAHLAAGNVDDSRLAASLAFKLSNSDPRCSPYREMFTEQLRAVGVEQPG